MQIMDYFSNFIDFVVCQIINQYYGKISSNNIAMQFILKNELRIVQSYLPLLIEDIKDSDVVKQIMNL